MAATSNFDDAAATIREKKTAAGILPPVRDGRSTAALPE